MKSMCILRQRLQAGGAIGCGGDCPTKGGPWGWHESSMMFTVMIEDTRVSGWCIWEVWQRDLSIAVAVVVVGHGEDGEV